MLAAWSGAAVTAALVMTPAREGAPMAAAEAISSAMPALAGSAHAAATMAAMALLSPLAFLTCWVMSASDSILPLAKPRVAESTRASAKKR